MHSNIEVRAARPADMDAILSIQEENQLARGGTLSASFPREWFLQAILEDSLIVAADAADAADLAGYVVFTPQGRQAHVPIVRAMLAACPRPEAYLHGPICVRKDCRRRGIASALFDAEREKMHHAPVLTFIRADNEASRRAHTGMGFREVLDFRHDYTHYVILQA